MELVHVKELLGLTGYVQMQPCVGMKKKYPTFLDETAGFAWKRIRCGSGYGETR